MWWPHHKSLWFKLPIALRKRWWRETDYGHKPPTKALLDDCAMELLLTGALNHL